MTSSWEPDTDFVFLMPTRILSGPGSYRETAAEVAELGCSRALIVTDTLLAEQTDIVSRIETVLGSSCIGRFDQVTADSGIRLVDAGAARATELGADCLVSVGGGSAMDTAKAMSVVMKNGGSIRDHFAVNVLTTPQVPHIAIPTTAGTGSEVTNAALVKDHEADTKYFLLDNQIFPRTAIVDPTLTTGLPAGLTAATAMDTVTHAVEAITSLCRNPVSESLAMQAISMVAAALPRVMDNPDSVPDRSLLLNAATMAGAAFCNAMVGLVHAAAHALGGVCSLHHGLANSIMLPHVIRFNAQTNAEDYLPVAAALNIATTDPAEAATAVADTVLGLASSSGLVTKLRDAGVAESQFDAITDRTVSDGAIINNCRPVMGAEEVLPVLKAAW